MLCEALVAHTDDVALGRWVDDGEINAIRAQRGLTARTAAVWGRPAPPAELHVANLARRHFTGRHKTKSVPQTATVSDEATQNVSSQSRCRWHLLQLLDIMLRVRVAIRSFQRFVNIGLGDEQDNQRQDEKGKEAMREDHKMR